MARKQRDYPAAKPSSNATPADREPATESDVDRIRQIIFGTQMEDYDDRFASLERKLKEAADTFRTEMARELASLRQEVVGKNSDLNGQLAETGRALRDEANRLAARQEHDAQELAERISQLQATLDTRIDSIVASAEEASKALRNQMQTQHLELLSTLEARLKELSAVKADRATLASLLTDLAGNLTAESGSRDVK